MKRKFLSGTLFTGNPGRAQGVAEVLNDISIRKSFVFFGAMMSGKNFENVQLMRIGFD